MTLTSHKVDIFSNFADLIGRQPNARTADRGPIKLTQLTSTNWDVPKPLIPLLIWTPRVDAGNTDAKTHVYPHIISEVKGNVINSRRKCDHETVKVCPIKSIV